MSAAEQITRSMGGTWHGSYGTYPGEGHSRSDRSVSIKDAPDKPEGVVLNCHAPGDDWRVEMDRLRSAGLVPEFQPTSRAKPRFKSRRQAGVSYFEFQDADGVTVCRKVRTDRPNGSKDFSWQHPDGQGGWKLGRGRTPLFYRLPELLAAPPGATIYFAEGEQKADKLASWGLAATSSKDLPDDLSALAGRQVVILPDNDAKGAEIAKALCERLEGVAERVIAIDLPGLPEAGDVMDWSGGPNDLASLVAAAVDGPERIAATPYRWRDPATLPRRPWIYGRQLLRGSFYVIIAPGATGKTSLKIGTALALVTGRPLLGAEVFGGPKRVWIWNLEDSLADLAFAIQGAALHWGISEQDLGDRLFVDSGIDGAMLKLARAGRDGAQIDRQVTSQIVAELKRRRIDVLMIDPFISSHGLNDENDNAAIDMVGKELSRIATEAQCSIVVAHHARKSNGAEVTAESARGASSLVDAARGGLALNTMTKAEAESFGIAQDQRRRFFRADDAKPNRAPPGAGSWYEMVSCYLGNGVDGGDSVGVATPWKAPDAFDGVSAHHLRAVQAKIADGAWRENVQAADWAGKIVAEVLGLDAEVKVDKRRAKAVMAKWIENGALRIEERPDRNGDPRKFVVVGSVA